ncbi:MAG: hypothetical protein WCW33_02965 [Candidatus Babeliales bacterium]
MKFVYIVGLSSIVMTSAVAGNEAQEVIVNIQEPGAQLMPPPGAQQIQKPSVSAAPKFVIRAPKKLAAGNRMKLLDAELCINPTCVLRTEIACTVARKMLQELPTMPEDRIIILGKIQSLLSSIRKFFVQIHGFAYLIRPVIEESLLGDVQDQTLRAQLKKNSALLNFLDCSAHEQNIFFESWVQTKEKLKDACTEIIIFFGDLTESLSPETREEYLKARAQFFKRK